MRAWEAKCSPEILSALWRGDQDELWQLAPCKCCCDEHTSPRCPARAWWGCVGQSAAVDEDTFEQWAGRAVWRRPEER